MFCSFVFRMSIKILLIAMKMKMDLWKTKLQNINIIATIDQFKEAEEALYKSG